MCSRDKVETYKLSGISSGYDVIFDERCGATICELYSETMLIPYMKITFMHYQTLSKKDTTWKIDINNLSVCSLQGLLFLLLDDRDNSADKNEEFYNLTIKNVLATTNGMHHQLFAVGIEARDIYLV